MYTEIMSPMTAEHIVNVIFKNISDFSKEGREDFWNSEFDDANSLMLWTLNRGVPKEKILPLLKDIVIKSSDLYFAVETVLHCKQDRGGGWHNIYNVADNDELRDILASRLQKEFIEEKKDIFEKLPDEEWTLVLYQWATNWTTDKKHLPIVVDYILYLIKKPKNLANLLSRSRDRKIEVIEGKPMSVPGGFSFDGLLGLLDISMVRDLALSSQNHKSLSKEEKDLIQEFLRITDSDNTIDEN